MNRTRFLAPSRIALLAALAAGASLLSGCTPSEAESLVNAECSTLWSDAALKSRTETAAEAAINRYGDGAAPVTLYNVGFKVEYLGVYDMSVCLGSFGPDFSVSSVSEWSSGGYDFYYLEWTMDWASGNGFTADVDLSLSNWSDPHLGVKDVRATASGTAVVRVDSALNVKTSVTVSTIDVDLSAKLTVYILGIPVKIDLSSQVRDAVKDMLEDDVIPYAFSGS